MTTSAEPRGETEELRQGLPEAATIAAVALLALVTLAMVGKFLHHDYKDAEVWYDVGRRVIEGRSLLHLQHYRYPPTFAVLVAPLCLLPWPAFFFVWYALNLALLGLCVRMAARLAAPGGGPPRLLWLPATMVMIYAIDNLFLGQTNPLITVLLYWTMCELVRGREWLAGVPLGLSIALKVFTFPWAAYLAYRGRVRALTLTLAVCAFCLFLLPAPVRGFERNLYEVKDWGQRVVAPYLSRGQAGDWGQHALDFGNQSLQAVLHRLLTRTDANVIARHGRAIYVNVADLTESQVNAVLLVAMGLLAAGFVIACGWRRPQNQAQYAIELAMSVIVLTLISAIAWTYFFVTMLLPFAVALHLVGLHDPTPLRPTTRRLLRWALWAQALVAVSLVSADTRAMGSVCWGTLLIYVALALAAWDLRRATPVPSSPTPPPSTPSC